MKTYITTKKVEHYSTFLYLATLLINSVWVYKYQLISIPQTL
ncbi:MAG: hypothetical protein H6543_02625 [Prevotellaceae bacterium]|nr:hypothetical protein [Prevotellaceae bacterium]